MLKTQLAAFLHNPERDDRVRPWDDKPWRSSRLLECRQRIWREVRPAQTEERRGVIGAAERSGVEKEDAFTRHSGDDFATAVIDHDGRRHELSRRPREPVDRLQRLGVEGNDGIGVSTGCRFTGTDGHENPAGGRECEIADRAAAVRLPRAHGFVLRISVIAQTPFATPPHSRLVLVYNMLPIAVRS